MAIYSKPDYPWSHSGPVLVLGSAPSVVADYEAALAMRPEADVIAVNEAGQLAPAQHLVSYHYEKMTRFRAIAATHFPLSRPITHCANVSTRDDDLTDDWGVDYWWPNGRHSGMTSAIFAARVADAIGYDEIVLCGAPHNGGDGYPWPTAKSTDQDPRFGEAPPDGQMATAAREACLWLASQALPVRSMSGFTREIFGGLD